jgi:hypothetical protein
MLHFGRIIICGEPALLLIRASTYPRASLMEGSLSEDIGQYHEGNENEARDELNAVDGENYVANHNRAPGEPAKHETHGATSHRKIF